MNLALLPVPILLPIAGGLLLAIWHPKDRRVRNSLVAVSAVLGGIVIWCFILFAPAESFSLFRLTDSVELRLRLDGAGRLFAGLVASLWPVAAVYSLGYMKETPYLTNFYVFFLFSFGVTIGVAMAGNLVTLYFFFEMLALSTVPLVIYPKKDSALRAGRTYLVYSIGGAAFAFIAVVFLISNGNGLDFVYGGSLHEVPAGKRDLYLLIYLFGFLGFGVKAAIWPFGRWLPQASVAPTNVTAILHAVAVVKSGAFAVTRLNWYCFGPDLLLGSWAQTMALGFCVATILYGSGMALRQEHFKLRLAYSTVSNISYVVLGATLMTTAGLAASFLHMIFHSVIKVLAFFCYGTVAVCSGREYVREMSGMGRHMPLTFLCFSVSACALSGVPLFCGFVSKWNLLLAAVGSGQTMGLVGTAAILISTLLITAYMFDIVIRAFFPRRDAELPDPATIRREGFFMGAPLVLLAGLCILFGLWSVPVKVLCQAVAAGQF